MRAQQIVAALQHGNLPKVNWIGSSRVIKIQYGATFHWGRQQLLRFVRSAHLPGVLILYHLIGARDNNVGGSDVSSCHAESVAIEFAPRRRALNSVRFCAFSCCPLHLLGVQLLD